MELTRQDFKEIIGWTYANYPYDYGCLNYINDLSGVEIDGARIGKNQYNLYYKYNVIKDIVLFPIIITPYNNKADKCFIANNREEFISFVNNPIFDKNFEVKVEKMVGCNYKDIRQHEIVFNNRIPFTELYSWSKEEFYGYKYVEF